MDIYPFVIFLENGVAWYVSCSGMDIYLFLPFLGNFGGAWYMFRSDRCSCPFVVSGVLTEVSPAPGHLSRGGAVDLRVIDTGVYVQVKSAFNMQCLCCLSWVSVFHFWYCTQLLPHKIAVFGRKFYSTSEIVVLPPPLI